MLLSMQSTYQFLISRGHSFGISCAEVGLPEGTVHPSGKGPAYVTDESPAHGRT